MSLCTGIAELDLATHAVFGGKLLWCAEIDLHASKVLDRRFPGIRNIGDLRNVEIGDAGSVDIVTAGFPCQDISAAGKGAGLKGEHSGLWFSVLEVIKRFTPQRVVIENVPLLQRRGLDVVLDGLSEAGYGGVWCFYRSGYKTNKFAHIGACHQRKRLFILAVHDPGDRKFVQHEPTPWPIGGVGSLLPTATASMTTGPGTSGREGGLNLQTAIAKLLPTPTARDWKGRNQRDDATCLPGAIEPDHWGDYAPAVERWETIFDQPAPSPVTDDNKLNPVFVEWMMGYPLGWVTDLDLPRTQQLKMLGKSVQPQTATAALRSMSEALANLRSGWPQ